MTGADSYKINGTSKAKMPHEQNVAALISLSEINQRQKMQMIADLEHSCHRRRLAGRALPVTQSRP